MLRPRDLRAVGDNRPYPDHGYTTRQWSGCLRVSCASTSSSRPSANSTSRCCSEDSTFYGDLFAHVVEWQGTLYLEDGLHRALRAALHQRPTLHARVLSL